MEDVRNLEDHEEGKRKKAGKKALPVRRKCGSGRRGRPVSCEGWACQKCGTKLLSRESYRQHRRDCTGSTRECRGKCTRTGTFAPGTGDKKVGGSIVKKRCRGKGPASRLYDVVGAPPVKMEAERGAGHGVETEPREVGDMPRRRVKPKTDTLLTRYRAASAVGSTKEPWQDVEVRSLVPACYCRAGKYRPGDVVVHAGEVGLAIAPKGRWLVLLISGRGLVKGRPKDARPLKPCPDCNAGNEGSWQVQFAEGEEELELRCVSNGAFLRASKVWLAAQPRACEGARGRKGPASAGRWGRRQGKRSQRSSDQVLRSLPDGSPGAATMCCGRCPEAG